MVSIWYVRCLWWFRTLFYYCWGSLESRDEHWAGLGLDPGHFAPFTPSLCLCVIGLGISFNNSRSGSWNMTVRSSLIEVFYLMGIGPTFFFTVVVGCQPVVRLGYIFANISHSYVTKSLNKKADKDWQLLFDSSARFSLGRSYTCAFASSCHRNLQRFYEPSSKRVCENEIFTVISRQVTNGSAPTHPVVSTSTPCRNSIQTYSMTDRLSPTTFKQISILSFQKKYLFWFSAK